MSTQRAFFVVCYLAAVGTTTAAASGGAPCASDLDCQLNGACTAKLCICNAAWTGANCSTLNLQPAALRNGYSSLGANISSWGAGVAFDPASMQYVMFNDEMNEHCGLGTWGANSHCILSTSATAAGPYAKQQVVLDSWCHGSSIARDPVSGRYVLQHMSNAAPKAQCTQCSSGVTPPGAPMGPCDASGVAAYTPLALLASSPLGPYTPAPKFLNGGNCETFFRPNGSVVVACPWGGKSNDPACTQAAFLTVSTAPHLDAALAGNWTHLPLTYLPAGSASGTVCMNWEDQNIWVDRQGYFHTIMHAFRGQNTSYPLPGCTNAGNGPFSPAGCTSLGGHGFSLDGSLWFVSPVPAYTAAVDFEDGSVVHFRARERPHLIFDSAGEPTHLISAVGDPGPGGNTGVSGQDHTFTLIQPLGVQ